MEQPNTQPRAQNAKKTFSKYMKCTGCEQVHVKIANINDDRPSCKTCGGTEFEEVSKGTAGYIPPYCDQIKDKSIWDGCMAVVLGPIHTWANRMAKKYDIKQPPDKDGNQRVGFSKNDIQDLAQSITVVSKLMLNWTRNEFVNDKFVKSLKGAFRSYLFSQMRRKGIKPKA